MFIPVFGQGRSPTDPLAGAVATLALTAGGVLTAHHPLWPWQVSAAFAVWVIAAHRWPQLWLFMLPALLPVANLSAWTGWIGLEEFDLLVLGSIAAGWWQRAERPTTQVAEPALSTPLAFVAFAALSAVALGRGLAVAGWSPLGWYQGPADPLNSLRVFKPTLYMLALCPLTLQAMRRDGSATMRHIATGMVVGLAAVSLVALWERAAYPGLLDFAERYRTTALFWEMHVGGASIDVYLVLAAPFALWALWTGDGVLRWAAASALALLAAHACLTTFSRGVYLGVALPLLLLAGWLAARRLGFASRLWLNRLAMSVLACAATAGTLSWALAAHGFAALGVAALACAALWVGVMRRLGARRKRVVASALLLVALLTEIVVVFSPDSFMRERVAAGERDFGSRITHWGRGLALLRTPADALFGLGLGRLPAEYAKATPRREFSGATAWPADTGSGTGAMVSGPATRDRFAGLYGLTQRLPIGDGGPYLLSFSARSATNVELDLYVCEMHLLYARECHAATVVLRAAPDWQHIDITPLGRRLSAGTVLVPRTGVFWLSVATSGATVGIDHISVRTPGGDELIDNGRFADGFAHWMPVATKYFVPWHIDNLYLELLIERGVPGLLAFTALVVGALRVLARRVAPAPPETPFFVASVGAGLLLGAVSSVLDTPRVSFLLLWWLAVLFGHKFTPKP